MLVLFFLLVGGGGGGGLKPTTICFWLILHFEISTAFLKKEDWLDYLHVDLYTSIVRSFLSLLFPAQTYEVILPKVISLCRHVAALENEFL